MDFRRFAKFLPSLRSVALSILAAALLILAFPDFEYSYTAWIALVPLLIALADESKCKTAAAVCGWLFGSVFFFGTSWWLSFAPIHYAGFPPLLAYGLVLLASVIVAAFPAAFAAVFAWFIQRFGIWAFATAPAIWVASEFARFWLTGNNWNAIAYSQAFDSGILQLAPIGGIYLISGIIAAVNSLFAASIFSLRRRPGFFTGPICFAAAGLGVVLAGAVATRESGSPTDSSPGNSIAAFVVAIQPNVPMSGITEEKWNALKTRHLRLADLALSRLSDAGAETPKLVIFPESPMNFAYETDAISRDFANGFARSKGVWLLLNSAEPDRETGKFFNSAVLVSPEGREAAQYDKIHLLPFGEAVPSPLEGVLPAFVGNFAYGRRANLIPVGSARAGIMICFESHFSDLSRQYAASGADALIELTNDGYLGPTPVLRQHLANAVFRAAETGLPLLRVTNVGITAFISPAGKVLEPSEAYTEDVRVWKLSRSSGQRTFYTRYGDWFAWLSVAVVAVGLAMIAFRRREP